jgi:ubiquinone/menaquinone biosynthesis C-methylase UbiE
MDKAEFDRVADEYISMHAKSIKASGESPDFFARYKIEDVFSEVSRRRLPVNSILDFGSGIGNSLPYFHALFPKASITCSDVSARSLEISRMRHDHIPAEYAEIVDDRLPFDKPAFDLSFSACVFHHIPHAQHMHWLTELKRVTNKGGALVIFEHNPANPVTVSAVRDCPFDDNAVLIRAKEFAATIRAAGWKEVDIVYRLFFPRPLAFARPLERFLRKLPLGAQYFVMARNT